MLGTLTVNGANPELPQGSQHSHQSRILSLVYVHSNADELTFELEGVQVGLLIVKNGQTHTITFDPNNGALPGGGLPDSTYVFRVQGEPESIPFYVLFGDTNADGEVSGTDIDAFNAAHGSLSGDANYVPALDYNGDGEIAGADQAAFTANANP